MPVSQSSGGSGVGRADDEHVWGSIVAGAAIGLIVGGALALVFAPRSGNQLRTGLGDAMDDFKDRAEQVIDDLQASASDLVARSRDVLDKTRDNLAQSVDAGKAAYRQTRDELTAQLEA